MSHFAIAVITSDPDNLSDMLAPYDEGISVEPYIRETSEEVIKTYKEKTGATEVDINSLIEWAKEWYDEDIDEQCNILTTYNPNSKWDWYSIGGRWSDLLDNIKGEKVLVAKIKDINFNSLRNDPVIINQLKEEWEMNIAGDSFYKPEYFIQKYKDLEGYIKYNLTFSTYAVLNNDGWHEPGQMGWFATTDATVDQERDWNSTYYETFIANVDPELYLIIVDCHI